MPNIDPSAIKMLSNYMSKNLCDIATLWQVNLKIIKKLKISIMLKVATKNALSKLINLMKQ